MSSWAQLSYKQYKNKQIIPNVPIISKDDTLDIVPIIPQVIPKIIPQVIPQIVEESSYNHFNNILKYYELLRFSDNGAYCAIMFESRIIPESQLLLTQLSRFLSSDWSVILFVTNNAYMYYKKLIIKLNNNIQVKRIDYKLNSIADYNNIMLNVAFWKQIEHYDKVLIFQTDTMIYKYGIDTFLKYDYVGAPWPEILEVDNFVGNGGFSLRTPSKVIECLNNIDNIVVPKYLQYEMNLDKLGNHPEDIILSQAMKQFNYKVPHPNTAQFFSIETCYFNDTPIGSHQLDIWNKPLHIQLLTNSIIPYNTLKRTKKEYHRYGWNYVQDKLDNIFTNEQGTQLDTWFDCNYLFDNVLKDDTTYWVGISHLTPMDTKHFFSVCNINKLKERPHFIKNLKTCKGIFVLSLYMKKILDNILLDLNMPHILVDVLYHPIPTLPPFFDSTSINHIKNILFIGTQLRRATTIFKIKTPYNKIWLTGRDKKETLSFLDKECTEYKIYLSQADFDSVTVQTVDDDTYDKLITTSIVILDVYEASANNTLIECIMKNTPILVRRHPAIEEYIGKDYPLFFESLDELQTKLNSTDLLWAAYKYLVNAHKEKLTMDHFISGILNSNITKQLLH